MAPYFCTWWLLAAGIPLPICLYPGMMGSFAYPAIGAVVPGVMVKGGAPIGMVDGGAPIGKGGVPAFGGVVAGLGAWSPDPRPGAMLAPPIGPAGPLGAAWAAMAGPGIPSPWLMGPGVPGAPIVPESPRVPGAPIGKGFQAW